MLSHFVLPARLLLPTALVVFSGLPNLPNVGGALSSTATLLNPVGVADLVALEAIFRTRGSYLVHPGCSWAQPWVSMLGSALGFHAGLSPGSPCWVQPWVSMLGSALGFHTRLIPGLQARFMFSQGLSLPWMLSFMILDQTPLHTHDPYIGRLP